MEVWENKKCCGNTSHRLMFLQIFRVLLNFHECFYDKENMFSISYINNVASTGHASSVFLLSFSINLP